MSGKAGFRFAAPDPQLIHFMNLLSVPMTCSCDGCLAEEPAGEPKTLPCPSTCRCGCDEAVS